MEKNHIVFFASFAIILGVIAWPRAREPISSPPLPKPEQTVIEFKTWEQYGCSFATSNFYKGRVRVLSRQNYYFEDWVKVSRTDFVLAWGVPSQPLLYRSLDINQTGRWFFYRFDPAKIDHQQIKDCMANIHSIPADKEIEKKLARVSSGDLIDFEGYLVDATMTDRPTWKTSLSRTDSGTGACELLYITKLDIVGQAREKAGFATTK